MARGSYRTKQRDLIMSCLKKSRTNHITVDKILKYLNAKGERVGQTTVYRYLDKLVKEGIVIKFTSSEVMKACYKYVGNESENHQAYYHLICLDCGEMMHLKCDYLDKLTTHMRDRHSFSLDSNKTVLYGHCDDCAALK